MGGRRQGHACRHLSVLFLLPSPDPGAPLPTIYRKAWAQAFLPRAGSQACQGSLCSSFFLPLASPPSYLPAYPTCK